VACVSGLRIAAQLNILEACFGRCEALLLRAAQNKELMQREVTEIL
jgi:hypothetical protein